MTDAQIQAYLPALATLILVGIGILFNNGRISDLNTNMNERIDDTNKRIDDTRGGLTEIRQSLRRLEDILVGKLTEVEHRLSRIESQMNLR